MCATVQKKRSRAEEKPERPQKSEPTRNKKQHRVEDDRGRLRDPKLTPKWAQVGPKLAPSWAPGSPSWPQVAQWWLWGALGPTEVVPERFLGASGRVPGALGSPRTYECPETHTLVFRRYRL